MVSNDDPSNSWTQKATTWEMAQARSPKTASNISRCKRSAYGRRPASALARSRSVDTNSACVGSDGNYGDGCGDGGGDGFNSHADSDYDGSLAKGSVFRSTLTSRSALRASLSSSSLSTMSDINSCISETEPFPFGEEQHLQDENWHPNVLKPLDKMHLKDYSKCRDFSSLANDGQSWGMSQTLKLQKGICNTTANGEKATQGTTCTSNRLFDKILINRNEASPSGLSNRKRGVCASPLDIDDVGECVIDSHGIPVERRRSRFRVLSPHKSLKKSLIDEENYFPPRESLDVSFCSTAASMDSDSDASMEENEKIVCSEGNVHTQNLQRLQTAPKVGHRCLIPLSEISEDHPQFQVMIKAIPSFDDLKFLLRLMRKDLKEKHTHSFGVRSKNSFITIAIPNQWTSDRKAKFLTWATTGEDSTDTTPGLGFNLRAAGGNVFFLQIVRKRGEIVRNFLELSFQHMKTSMKAGTETGMKTSIPICSQKLMKKHMSTQPLTNRSNEIPDENKMFFDLTTPRPRSQTLPCTSFVRRDSSSALSTKMENLQVSISSSIKAPPPSTTKLNESLVRTVTLESVDTLKLALTEKQARNSRRASFKVSKFNEPPVGVQDLFAGKSSSPRMKLRRRPVKHHSDMPTKDNSGSPLQALRKSRPRHSGEHSIGGQDLLLHMGCHGLTPKSNVRKHYGSTPKASFTPKRDHKSKRSGRIKKCLTLNTEDEYTPKPQSSDSFQYPPMPSSRKPLDTPILEMLETPLTRRKHFCWGSTEVDWGNSKKCNEPIIEVAISIFEEACPDYYCLQSDEVCNFTSNTEKKCEIDMHCYDEHLHSLRSTPLIDDVKKELDECQNFYGRTTHHLCGSNVHKEHLSPPPTLSKISPMPLKRRESVGSSQLASLNLTDSFISLETKKRMKSFAKRKRVSLCAAAFYDYDYDVSANSSRLTATNLSMSRRSMSPSFVSELPSEKLSSSYEVPPGKTQYIESPANVCYANSDYMQNIFSFLVEEDILCSVSLVCTQWANAAAFSHAALLSASVGFYESDAELNVSSDELVDDDLSIYDKIMSPAFKSTERSWEYMKERFPWGSFLSEGGYKKVYKVWNNRVSAEEAISVMDIEHIHHLGEKQIVGRELQVSTLLSSLARRNICPNFVKIHGVFTCPFAPTSSAWGDKTNKVPEKLFDGVGVKHSLPTQPTCSSFGNYQYIRMELCRHGDVESYLKCQTNGSISAEESRQLLFQMAFSLHVASDKFGLKHYDVKLLNFFLQDIPDNECDNSDYVVLRYGIGEHIFCLRMPAHEAKFVKLADFGTSQLGHESNAQPVTAAQLTTLENSPPEFLILGDSAKQGHGHDNFGLGLCMLHLFTGNAPYEEIMSEVVCPPHLRNELGKVWESSRYRSKKTTYYILQSIILDDAFEHVDGSLEGCPDQTLYDTLYRFLVLLGLPDLRKRSKGGVRVWNAITSTLGEGKSKMYNSKLRRSKRNDAKCSEKNTPSFVPPDEKRFIKDQALFSLDRGTNPIIAIAREKLEMLEGGMDLLKSLLTFDADSRATALDVINSPFMSVLRETKCTNSIQSNDNVYSYTSYYTC